MVTAAQDPVRQRQWYIVGRWQEYDGEGKSNLLRLVTICLFYLLQLIHFYFLAAPGDRDVAFHRAATALAVAASLVSLGVLLCLRSRMFPAGLKFLSTGADLLLLTMLAAAGAGPNSPVVFAYFLVIAMAALRFSLPLVWFATLFSISGYLALLGIKDDRWFDATHVVDPVEQLMALACLAMTGIIVGQVIRRVRSLADEYSRRVASAHEVTSDEPAKT
ncbi:MAG: hypothetical protein ACC628_07190 [Pirellulaceae bacterium]